MLVLLSLFFFVFGNWLISLTSLDEGRNASAVLNMLSSGELIVPYYNCQVRFEKPPMLYYFGLLSSKVFGLNEFSLRLVSGLSAIGFAFFTYLLAKLYFDPETAKRAFLILLTLPHLWIESRAFVPEMLFSFFMLTALYFFLKNRRLLGWIFLSFAFLTKGPVGVFLPLSAYLILKRDLRFIELRGILTFLILGGSWYYLMLLSHGWEYFYKFFIYENIMRYTGQASFHPYPFYYYFVVLLIAFIFYIPALPKVFPMERKLLPFLLWGVFVVLFFALAKNRLHHYILFSYPAFSIVLAYYLSERYIRSVLVVSGLLLALLISVAPFYEEKRFQTKTLAYMKNFEVPIYFYKGAEISPLPFYLKKCIPKTDQIPTEKALLVSREEVKECQKLLTGREFDGTYNLYLCNP
ncbi:ArnT family glycosyltransferase [Thermocrinis sp.]